MISKNTIPYIGTEILLLTKNDHNSTQKAPKSIIPKISKAQDISHHLTVSNPDLRHFLKSDLLGFAGAVFHGFLPPEGDLTTKLTMYNNSQTCKHNKKTKFWFSLNFQNIIRRSPQASPTKNWKIKSAVKECTLYGPSGRYNGGFGCEFDLWCSASGKVTLRTLGECLSNPTG